MSDYFIPLNHSTPVQQKWQPGQHPLKRFQIRRNKQNSCKRSAPYNKWNNSSQCSFSTNTSNNNCTSTRNKQVELLESRTNIDAYLHPSMLQDPWESLRQRSQCGENASMMN